MFLHAQLKKAGLMEHFFRILTLRGKKKSAMEELVFFSVSLKCKCSICSSQIFFLCFESLVSAFQKVHIWQEFGRQSDRLGF